MPATPKPPGARRRRNAGQAQWVQLPAEGRKGRVPAPRTELELGQVAMEYWKTLWRSPMAVTFTDADIQPLTRLVVLVDQRAAHERGEFIEEREDGLRIQYATFNGDAEIRQLEDRYGVSPLARRRLQWEVAKGEVVDLPRQSAGSRRLRAIEA